MFTPLDFIYNSAVYPSRGLGEENAPDEYAIVVENISKEFAGFRAVDGISFRVRKGEIFGFLGANGAGKTTAIRILCGILEPTGGEATVAGFNIRTEVAEMKKRIGYMSQKFSLYNDLTVEENIRFFAGLYGVEGNRFDEQRRWVLQMAGLVGKEKMMTSNLSGGWKQRLALGCAVMHDPELIFLDEPTAGVDPISRRRFWELIYSLSRRGITVLITTHYMDEAEHCNRIVLMETGKIIASGSPAQLKNQALTGHLFRIVASPHESAMKVLGAAEAISYLEPFGLNIHAMSADEHYGLEEIRGSLSAAGCQIEMIKPIAPTLEDVFLALIGN